MLRLFAFLLTGCWHKWGIHREGRLDLMDGDRVVVDRHYYDLRCERCGAMKGKAL